MTLDERAIQDVVRRALAEDAPWGDVTSRALVPEQATMTAVMEAREPGIMAGGQVIIETFAQVDSSVVVTLEVEDGVPFDAGDTLAVVAGSARSILLGERTALNIVQRMSAIATLTRRYVDEVAHTQVHIVDTRKTTPGLRALEKYAVTCGGGHNHRFSLSDAAMVKDNHLAALMSEGLDITSALLQARERLGHTVHLEVEVDRLDQLAEVLAARPDSVLLDNFSLNDLKAGVALVNGAAVVEASGGVNLSTVRGIAETGVDIISVGALTHSVSALDIGLDIELQA